MATQTEDDPNSYQDADRTLYQLPPPKSCQNHHTSKEDYDLEALVQTLHRDGVVAIPSVYSDKQIDALQKAHRQNFEDLQSYMSETEAFLKPYRHDFDKKRYYLMPHYEFQDEDTHEWHEVIEISPGRLDYTYGMNPDDDDAYDECDEDENDNDNDESNMFASLAFQRPKILAQLMDRLLISDYQSYAGALPSAQKSDDGPWHRDTYLLFDDETVDINLPHPYYFTVLIPLVDIDRDNGATEFLLQSHHQTCQEALEKGVSYQPSVPAGSILVFDGRICHRGRRNLTEDDRTVLYMVWTKKWYNDY